MENYKMKAAVIGNGKVGKAIFRELQNLREVDELVIVGRNAQACYAEAEDYMDALPMRIDCPPRIDGGGYELAAGADILIYCASAPARSEDRMSLADTNVKVMKEVFAQADKYAPDAIVIAVTNPLDVITTAIQVVTGRPAAKVIGTGTLLDTARLKKIISRTLDISANDVDGFVLGEHGETSVVLNSSIRVAGMEIEEYIERVCGGAIPVFGDGLDEDVREAGRMVFRGKGYTSAGVAAAAARIVYDIVNDTHRVYPVSTVLSGQYGVDGYAVSVPCMIGKNGVESVIAVPMSAAEAEKFRNSADVVRAACVRTGLISE